jgi:hypothetical protein
MKRLLALLAGLEGVTGVALMISPAVVARLLLGAELSAAGAAVGRLAGCALVALGIACWPGRGPASMLTPAVRAMLTYNLLVTCYLVFLGMEGQYVGFLLWPAMAIHGLFTLLLVRMWFKTQLTQDSKG